MRVLKIFLIASFFLFIVSLTFTNSNDLNQDLGRHLALGEIITKTRHVPQINLFSYTYPDYPFVNHHWLSEVFFYQLVSHFGTFSLVYLKIFLIVFSLAIVLKLSFSSADFIPTMISVLLFSPLLLERLDIRPELFAYVLFSLLLFTLISYPKNSRLIYLIPAILFFWINLHISFIFGIVVFVVFVFLKKFYNPWIIFLSLLALFLNPNGIKGIIAPLTIFQNYGYPIVENQNLLFLSQVTVNPLIKYFFGISPVVVVSLIALVSMRQFIQAVILAVFFTLSVLQIRHLPFFVLAAIPTVAVSINNLKSSIFRWVPKIHKLRLLIIIGFSCIYLLLTLLFISNRYYQLFDMNKRFGLGFDEDSKKAAEFLKKNNLPKHIFNNFDVGGYLAYRLYPHYSLFIDNRPEAYPQGFLQNTYVRLQQDEKVRNRVFETYDINTIFFAHTDQTPWAQSFIQSILKEKQWKLIYADASVVILSKKTDLPDVRDGGNYFQQRIDQEDNYIHLLYLVRLFTFMGNQPLAQKSFLKAQKINPYSCSIRRFVADRLGNTPDFYQTQEMRQKNWWCF